jgi:hypothetical protein
VQSRIDAPYMTLANSRRERCLLHSHLYLLSSLLSDSISAYPTMHWAIVDGSMEGDIINARLCSIIVQSRSLPWSIIGRESMGVEKLVPLLGRAYHGDVLKPFGTGQQGGKRPVGSKAKCIVHRREALMSKLLIGGCLVQSSICSEL